ncbi:inorganic pyrophosphatase [Klebsiella michiganensis]|uniref:inorganic diphosphatase n=1 Tax=Klebsiella michiganensis TaxID=1134687 RepID=A0A7H4PQS2_9ENTR|nr:inorganic pyrophosphatase [Klebsiella michiganensis]
MSLLNVPAGKDLPEDIYVVIEIPANADPIKYEVDKRERCTVRWTVSCPRRCSIRATTATSTTPCPWTANPVDVLVPTPYPLEPGSVIRCRPVGVLKMTDESGEDAKLVAVPHTKLSKRVRSH